MRFRDVHHQKSHSIAVLLVKFVEGRNLPPEWRSGITSEHQHHRLLLVQDRQLHSFGLVQFEQGEIRRGISDLQISGTVRVSTAFQTGRGGKGLVPASSP